MKELGYHSISAFIRDAILDEKLTVKSVRIPSSTITHTPSGSSSQPSLHWMDACNIPGVDPALIHRHANRIRLIIVELVGKMDYLRHLLGESHEKK